ncbi:uncharacterized protein [Hemitrygon akajei]|uniref:uncharacterized protein n=1 Tax=Hemitrygon akajei TaxID=2704970 RepID=UPI003BFA1639
MCVATLWAVAPPQCAWVCWLLTHFTVCLSSLNLNRKEKATAALAEDPLEGSFSETVRLDLKTQKGVITLKRVRKSRVQNPDSALRAGPGAAVRRPAFLSPQPTLSSPTRKPKPATFTQGPNAWNMKAQFLLVLLSALALPPARAEVVAQFNNNNCGEFFRGGLEPRGLEPASPARLCQRHKGRYYFAGLFDRDRRIPVYSAHVFGFKYDSDDMRSGSDKRWKYEPQLVNWSTSADMRHITKNVKNQEAIRQSQPVEVRYDIKYYGSYYSRGHLNPNSYQGSYTSRSATYTLTNTVPQTQAFNSGAWARQERATAQLLQQQCANVAVHLVTGAVPYRHDVWIPGPKEQREAVPQLVWSAYCCAGGKSGAALAHNDGKEPADLAEGLEALQPGEVRVLGVEELEWALQQRLHPDKEVKIFPAGCY